MDYNEIYKKELFSSPDCYLTCDGYCCKNFFGKHFKFLDKEAVILPMIDDEYEVFKNNGGLKNIEVNKKEIPIKDKILIIYLLKCKEKGLCKPHSNRPFICRTYPYFPIVDIEGNVIDFEYASLMDILVDDAYHKCTIRSENIKSQIKQNLPKPSPKTIFAFMLVKLLIDYIRKYIPDRIKTIEDEKKVIFKFETLMLKNTIFKDKNFKEEVYKVYDKIVKRYGEFL